MTKHERENLQRAARSLDAAANLLREAQEVVPDWLAVELSKVEDDLRYWQGRLEANDDDLDSAR